jgi:hypothetical protein
MPFSTSFWMQPSSTFSPSNISGLQFWVRSDLGITKDGSDLVSQWNDQSGNARNLTEATNQPLWVNSLINGYPAIRFDGSNDKMRTASFSISQPLTIFMVAKPVTHTNLDGYIFGGNLGAYQGTSPVVKLHDQAVGDGAQANSGGAVYELYKFLFNGTSSVISIDDGSDQTSGTNLTSSFTSGVSLSVWNTDIRFGNMEVAEVCIYDSSISGTNLTNLKNYFNTRYVLW